MRSADARGAQSHSSRSHGCTFAPTVPSWGHLTPPPFAQCHSSGCPPATPSHHLKPLVEPVLSPAGSPGLQLSGKRTGPGPHPLSLPVLRASGT